MTVVAIYPGRFDPVTNGHRDIARRASRLFDRVIVAPADLKQNYLFTTDERVAMFREAVADCPNIEVKSFTGLTVEFARDEGATVMVRSMRAVTDFEAEFEYKVEKGGNSGFYFHVGDKKSPVAKASRCRSTTPAARSRGRS